MPDRIRGRRFADLGKRPADLLMAPPYHDEEDVRGWNEPRTCEPAPAGRRDGWAISHSAPGAHALAEGEQGVQCFTTEEEAA